MDLHPVQGYTEHMRRSDWNPRDRFSTTEIEWDEAPPPARLVVTEDHSRSILSKNASVDIPFTWSVNPYRGCTHACAYCYARDFHPYLGLGAGTDFEQKIRIKPNAAALLQAAFDHPSWRGEAIALSGATDPYQPLERKHRITRAILEVCARYRNPVGIITRSPLVTRDLDLLQSLAEHHSVRVNLSIPILDEALCRKVEPGAAAPRRRLEAIAKLSEAGIPVGVSVSPVIPGLNDALIPDTLKAARDAGAVWAWRLPVRLAPTVEAVFFRRLQSVLPLRAQTVARRIARMRGGGSLAGGGAGRRMRGQGKEWNATARLFDLHARRLGLSPPPTHPLPSSFRRPGQGQQLGLF